MEERIPLVVDCDTGTDDAIALAAVFGCPEADVLALTSVAGNVPLRHVLRNNLDVTEFLGVRVPVSAGASGPLGGEVFRPDGTHGSTGLGDVKLARSRRRPDPRTAPQVIRDAAVSAGGSLELLCTGPLTNLAAALLLCPGLPKLVRHLTLMGGAMRGGNVSPTAEFNMRCDPEAAHLVLQSGIPTTMVGLDVTEKARFSEEDCAEIERSVSAGARLTAELLRFMFRRRDAGGEDAYLHDALAAAAVFCPQALVLRPAFADTERRGEYTRGHTFVEFGGGPGRAPNVSFAVELRFPVFRDWLIRSVTASPLP